MQEIDLGKYGGCYEDVLEEYGYCLEVVEGNI